MDPHRDFGDAERLTDLPVGQPLHLPQDDDALVRLAELAERREQAAAEVRGLGLGLRAGLGARQLLRRLVVEARRHPSLRGVRPAAPQQVVTRVAGHPQQPGAEALLVHAVLVAPEAEQYLLGHVLRFLPVREQVAGEGVDPAAVRVSSVVESRQHPERKTKREARTFQCTAGKLACPTGKRSFPAVNDASAAGKIVFPWGKLPCTAGNIASAVGKLPLPLGRPPCTAAHDESTVGSEAFPLGKEPSTAGNGEFPGVHQASTVGNEPLPVGSVNFPRGNESWPRKRVTVPTAKAARPAGSWPFTPGKRLVPCQAGRGPPRSRAGRNSRAFRKEKTASRVIPTSRNGSDRSQTNGKKISGSRT